VARHSHLFRSECKVLLVVDEHTYIVGLVFEGDDNTMLVGTVGGCETRDVS
jgi:hypothetical protein